MLPLPIPQILRFAIQHHQAGELDQAETLYQRIIEQQPDHLEALNNLGVILQLTSRLAEAESCYRQFIAIQPGSAGVYANLGLVVQQQGRPEEAIACCRKALELDPASSQAANNMGVAMNALGRPLEAESWFRRAIVSQANNADACTNLGDVLARQGRIEEAIAAFHQAATFGAAKEHSNLLYALYFHPSITQAQLLQAHQQWEARYARPLYQQLRPHGNDRDPARRLLVGYVSPNFCRHVVGLLIAPLLANHDHQQFEVFCYCDTPDHDDVTLRLRKSADTWRDTARLSDQQLATQIRQDGIDILVDLTQHMPHNRMLALARKPAPVQVAYLGYNAPTGLATIDYRLTDRHMESGIGFRVSGFGKGAEPMPDTRNPIPETPSPLPDCYWCYAPAAAPQVNDLPASRGGRITFGSFNNFAKVNVQVIETWSQLLRAVPGSELQIVIAGGPCNTHVWQAFEQNGIVRGRIQLLDHRHDDGYWELYHHVDIALDPFPYNGGVTTLDSLYMGVPVVTLAGNRPLARAGVSILSNLGLPELIAQTRQHYVQIAAELASDLPRLAELRRTLRQRMQHSPLMDGPRFARGVEALYRQMWRTWALAGQ